jgi:[acyl-carrier-protein] S-malonyltransferase
VPILSNVTAEPLVDAGRIRALLAEQVRSPVEWVRCVERMVAEGIDVAVECGTGSALSGMVKRIAPQVRTANVGDLAGLETAVAVVEGVATAPASV